MVIGNVLIGGKLKNIVFESGKITAITEEKLRPDIDASGLKTLPGLIDVHTHARCGVDTMDCDLETLAKFEADSGTTSFLPTTMTMGYPELMKVCESVGDFEGANILGIHFEGPYISEKKKGAQNSEYIKNPSVDEFRQFKNVKMITLAPELEGSFEFIKEVSKDTVVSIGHTDCDYGTAVKAIENGADCLTHTFNAMPPLLHRDPGPIGAAAEKHIYAQLICDGLHVHKAAVLSLYKMFGADRLVLISDSIRPAGLPDGEYICGGLEVTLKNNEARLHDGTLAGSTADLLYCVKKAVEFGIPESDAVKMATETPANLLGVKKGKLEVGYDADIILTDCDFNLKKVIIGGKIYK